MNLWEKFDATFKENPSATAFCTGNRFYSYAQFTQYITGSRQLLQKHLGKAEGLPVGVLCHDSIETFAAIFAIGFSGHHFVPLHPHHPAALNNEKIEQSGLKLILSAEMNSPEETLKAKVICNKEVTGNELLPVSTQAGRAYILFTSGSTGKPKGVPVSADNMMAYLEGFLDLYPDLSARDRFLQTYDLTSDAAFTAYLVPLYLGASVYTIPPGSFKYLSIVKMLQQHPITFTKFTPSVLNYLRPYFKSMRFEALRHSHFGGEALPLELAKEWSQCIPNAEISNGYGPTETTITCTIHRTPNDKLSQKVYNGIISIGKPFKEVKTLIVDENDQQVAQGEKGELCIGGKQVMEGYLNTALNEIRTFLVRDEKGLKERYYRSGDLVIQDEQGFLFFCGRKDDQLKISGYRVEPAEIEMALSQLTRGAQSKAYGFTNKSGTESIVVFTEQRDLQAEELKDKLRELLPSPLIPEKIISIARFPINSSGKADKKALFETYSSQIYE
ncbi:MAG TPA: AMP-binding protein [Prolixibacteraceae bacterium]|nr:AMP-binding protein [Prolixibacteraceae bacterium]